MKLFDQVRPHMEVVGSDGKHLGKVDHEDGQDRIKLLKNDGDHHFINWDWVDRVEGGKLVLNVGAREAAERWQKDPAEHINR